MKMKPAKKITRPKAGRRAALAGKTGSAILERAKKIKSVIDHRSAHISATDPAADWESEFDMLRAYIGDLNQEIIEILEPNT